MITLKPLNGFEGYFICKESGIIWSSKTKRWLKIQPNRVGYGRTAVYKNGVRYRVFNHIKVVEHYGDKFGKFIPAFATTLREINMSIDHLNEDKLDPSFCNLELLLHSENVKRMYERKRSSGNTIPDLV